MSKIAIVGCDASGKTVLVSALSDYYQAGRRPDQSCFLVPNDTLTRRYVDNLHRVMRINHEWPQATNDIVGGGTLNWTMMCRGKPLTEIQLMDFGGENFRSAFRMDERQANPEVVTRLKDFINGADFVVITVSLEKMLRNLSPETYRELEHGDIEYDRDSEAQWVTSGLLKLVSTKLGEIPPGVVVALTQADKYRETLENLGGPKATFVKCWPMIAALYPELPVVAVASVDRTTEDGLPGEGYRTDGVLTVMKAFARYAFGDGEELCAKLDALKKQLENMSETEHPRPFLVVIRQYRELLKRLWECTVTVEDLYRTHLADYERFLSDYRGREAAATQAELVRRQNGGEAAGTADGPADTVELKAPRFFIRRRITLPSPVPLSRFCAVDLSRRRRRLAVFSLLALFLGGCSFMAWWFDDQRKKIERENEIACEVKVKEASARVKEIAARRAKEMQEALEREMEAQKRLAVEKAREERIRDMEQARKEKEAALQAAELKRQEEYRIQEKKRQADEAAERARAVERERQRLMAEAQETANLLESLRRAVNGEALESGRKFVAELSSRQLTDVQKRQLAQAKRFLDQLENAVTGDQNSMVLVGNQYYSPADGSFVGRMPEKAFVWYEKATRLGSAQAFYFLSLMTEQGTGCSRDEALSGRYCLKAARLGYPEAMFWVGVYCREGSHGFEKSPATAYKYLSMAKAAGFQKENLESMLQSVVKEKDGKTIDGRYPENPLELPIVAQEKSSWWFL